MEKVISVDGKEVGFRASALTPRLYRHKIGRDIVRDMNQLKRAYEKAISAQNIAALKSDASQKERQKHEEALQDAQLSVLDLEVFENATYIMAKQYDSNIPDTPEEWLETFSVFSIYEILPQIMELWQLNQKTTSIPKKK